MKLLPLVLLFLSSSAMADTNISAPFVQTGNNGVAILNIIEAPVGVINGYLTTNVIKNVAAKDQTAQFELQSDTTELTGNVLNGNFTMRSVHPILSPMSIMGSLKDNQLLVTFANGNQYTFVRSTLANYQTVRTQLSLSVSQMDILFKTIGSQLDSIKTQTALMDSVNQEVAEFVQWGNARVERYPNINKFYAPRVRGYSECLTKIKSLAAQRAPKWHWQECAIDAMNDAYALKTYSDEGRQLISIYEQKKTTLTEKIKDAENSWPVMKQAMLELTSSGEQLHQYRSTLAAWGWPNITTVPKQPDIPLLKDKYMAEIAEWKQQFNTEKTKLDPIMADELKQTNQEESRLTAMAKQISDIYYNAN